MVDTRAEWSRDLADPEGGTAPRHNDVCPKNVVFRDGRAAALIDFDFAAPGAPSGTSPRPPATGCQAPMLDPGSASALRSAGPDAAARLRTLADG